MKFNFYIFMLVFENKLVHSWDKTYECIRKRDNMIHTTQMAVMSTELLAMGYKIFIHEKNKEVYEIKLGSDNTCTDKEIRIGHNLFKMWENNAFATIPTLLQSAT